MRRNRPRRIDIFRIVVMLICIAVFIYSASQIFLYLRMTLQEKKNQQNLQKYRPEITSSTSDTMEETGTQEQSQQQLPTDAQQSLFSLQTVNEDLIGWLYLPDTRIDYPVLQGKDNDFYLTHDFYRQFLKSGSIFMDYRSTEQDFHRIIYGHHMKNGTMFADVQNCRDEAFFRAHTRGYFTTFAGQFEIEFFAFLIVPSGAPIYTLSFADTHAKQAFLEYIAQDAMYCTDANVTEQDQLISLSTCTYEFEDARAVLVGRIVR